MCRSVIGLSPIDVVIRLIKGVRATMPNVRKPAVAGTFYPAEPAVLQRTVNELLSQVSCDDESPPKAIIAPHAGYIYSGPIAASAYARLKNARNSIKRVILLGPAHRIPLQGLALTSADAYCSPLGAVPVDRDAVAAALDYPQVHMLDAAHAQEHSLEVHLPFLQSVLGDFLLVPIVVGEALSMDVARVIDALWEDEQTFVAVSSDLSHYHDYERARKLDTATSRWIEQLTGEPLGYEHACGRNPIKALLLTARRRRLAARTVDLRNSGDTGGLRNQVVGYGAYVFE